MRAVVVAIMLLGACADGGGVSREIGARCEFARECDDRCLTPTADYPDGLCTLDCQSDRECPDDARCVDKEGGVCLFSCNFTADCTFLGPSWDCKELNGRQDMTAKVKVCIGT